MSDFLPPEYAVPSGSDHYMKFEQGENRFRILSKPIIGWEDWDNKKPIRFKMTQKPDASIDPQKPVKHFWAMVVYNVLANKLQILEITQSGIQKSIKALAADPDWGNPNGYDIKVTRKGSGLETEYALNPVPHKPLSEEIGQLYDASNINLEALFDGGDPFKTI